MEEHKVQIRLGIWEESKERFQEFIYIKSDSPYIPNVGSYIATGNIRAKVVETCLVIDHTPPRTMIICVMVEGFYGFGQLIGFAKNEEWIPAGPIKEAVEWPWG